MDKEKLLGRRNFLKKSALGMAGAGIIGSSNLLLSEEKAKEEDNPSKIKNYRMLGRTGFKVSDISSGYCNNVGVLNAILDSGVNYIDTAESYGNQPAVGNALKGRDRKKIFITSKLEIKKDLSKEGFLKRFRKCLEELQTEYIDCMMIHSPEEINTIKTSGFHEAMKQLKSEGRLKYIGVSNHGSGWYLKPKVSMDKILLAAAADGRFDVMLMTYNFLQENMGAKVLEVCKEKNIGTTLMKVNPVGKYLGLKERIEKWEKEGKKIADTYKKGFLNYKEKAEKADVFIKKYNLKDPIEIRDAAIKYVLDNPNVNSVCCSMRNFEQVDMFLKLSGTKLSDQEKVKLQAYKAGCGELYCRHACGICEPECPHNVPVNTIMRYNHYFEAQGKEKYALKKYAQLDTPKADLCKDCNGACEKACPHKVPIHAMMNMAHRKLSLV